ncbi:MAG: hypothetical protein H8E55_48990 [Pelagibacterales bacterium]|nr:hypothetical protein [Pelagibacterales bacterium]
MIVLGAGFGNGIMANEPLMNFSIETPIPGMEMLALAIFGYIKAKE